MSNQNIETEWVECQNKHLQQISMAPTRNYTKTIIQLNINKTATCEGSLLINFLLKFCGFLNCLDVRRGGYYLTRT